MKVIIFSRGREIQLLKTLKYFNRKRIQCIVFHNSDRPLRNIEHLSNVQYVVADIPIGGRFRLAKDYIDEDTNYIISSDDEIYTPRSLVQTDTFLKDNLTVASVAIPAIGIAIGRKGFYVSPAYEHMRGYKNLKKFAVDRFDYHFTQRVGSGSYQGAMYRAMRGLNMKELLDLLGKMENVSTPYVYEIVAEIYLTNAGEAQSLDETGWVRNWIEEPIKHKKWDRNLYFTEWWANQKYSDEVRFFKNEMKKYIPLLDELKNEEIFWINLLESRNRLENREKAQKKNSNWISHTVRKVSHMFYRNLPKKIRHILLSRAITRSVVVQDYSEILEGAVEVLT